MPAKTDDARMLDWLIFLAVPCLFSSNIIFGRGILGEIGPFITAFIRWFGAMLIVLPFMLRDWRACYDFMRYHSLIWLSLGMLGMGICGGAVYWALTKTTAANATLIYTTASLFTLFLQWLFQGRRLDMREISGMMLGFCGVAVIVLKGAPEALFALHFNSGDLIMILAAIAFALYSLLLRHPAVTALRPISLFGTLALSGALVLFLPAAAEIAYGAPLPTTRMDFLKLGGIILFASLMAFYSFQHSVRVFGPALASMTLYLMPPVSIIMAVTLLGETFRAYHAAGIVLVMSGLFLATARRRKNSV
ncbi:DMT family transporter [Allorhizobium sp. BGMRC 0089]|uniref:DMT family transporter n=1 Tax=Allorhizobium sonneratiae TaxID=2934936 RepID=UPI002034989C|nr:DMT family transporter [Allorhizobium sonneratiae]MCM2292960.1 DMT family transporter [Allorhizobium sonneratiae]